MVNKKTTQASRRSALTVILTLGALSTACTGQIPGSFRFRQQEENFGSQQEINTKLDLLWVVDNSSSMDVSQARLRAGFRSFATKYMKPSWDIRVAVISTDTYLAHPAFQGWLSQTVPGSIGYVSPYLAGRKATLQNPQWNPQLINLSNGALDQGIKYREMVPAWGPEYGRLLAGIHDGPIAAFCFEGMPYFLRGITQCQIRDDQNRAQGPSKCLDPGTGGSSLSECVNTVQNDTVRSGRAIIETMPPTGTLADSAWTDRLIRDFMINLSAGSSGHGSERGLSSLLQLLADNEPTETAFFRKGSLRAIIFVSDEDDQSTFLPANPGPGFEPFAGYGCDQSSLSALNPSANISNVGGICCSDPTKGCRYGSSGISCPTKIIDGVPVTVSVCPDASQLIPLASVKSNVDEFFRALDGSPSDADPGYFVASIVPTTASAITALQSARNSSDTAVGTIRTVAVDRGDRYLDFGRLVSGDALELDISSEDYSPILESIGRKIIEKKSSFKLNFAPTSTDDMIVSIRHADGTETLVPASAIAIEGKTLRITDLNFVLGFKSSDQISINYQPRSNL